MSTQTYLVSQFVTPIYVQTVDHFEMHQKQLLDFIYAEREQLSGVDSPSLKNTWFSPRDLFAREEPEIKWMLKVIGEFADACVNNSSLEHRKGGIVMRQCRASIRGHGGWSPPHHHYGFDWAGVFYVSVTDALLDVDQRGEGGTTEFLNPSPYAKHSGFPEKYVLSPRDGMIVLFPAYVHHLVQPNLSQYDRIAINFMLDIMRG